MLKAEGIIKKYQIPGRKKDLLEALSGVSIELADNSITAIVGESGSGKSTLARILSYIELPDAGKVTLDNLTVTGVKRKTLQKMRGKVQLVMQDAASSLDPHQNVLQILDEPLHLLLDMGKEDRKKRVEELLDMVNLGGDILNRRPDELSGGQQKRLCVARALATEPQHIIFDESFSGLDVTLRKQILHLLGACSSLAHTARQMPQNPLESFGVHTVVYQGKSPAQAVLFAHVAFNHRRAPAQHDYRDGFQVKPRFHG